MSEQPTRDGVQLGCGTLIIIALIVMFFSGGRDTNALRTKLEDVSQKLDRLEKKLDAISERFGPQVAPESKPSDTQ